MVKKQMKIAREGTMDLNTDNTPQQRPDPHTARSLPFVFTASGSEYLRIWIVNVLLTVVTLGFYLPFAKARRLRYFYANQLVDGEPLAFHGDPWKMLRGHVLMLLLFGAYGLSGRVSLWASLVMLVLLAAAWPALWRSGMRFRLHNTSWRGLRMGFDGSLAGAYKALSPMLLPVAMFALSNAWLMHGVDPDDKDAVKAAGVAGGAWIGVATLLFMALWPLCLYRIKRYQHEGYRYANQHARFGAHVGQFYSLGWRTGLLYAVAALCVGLLLALALPVLVSAGSGAPRELQFVVAPILVVGYLAVLTMLRAYSSARVQNLVWNKTQTEEAQFASQLGAWQLAKLGLKNLALTVVTLGLYRPFAVVNTTALRWGAMGLHTAANINAWHSSAAGPDEAAHGEMAGDFFGIDVGL
jgi:uncharacterized membrane protein YjgN (DUF898 family)